ncbi:MAG: DUF4403 family protein [Saprospiraceae bacterium]|nr:DUF4403 family protein [Saprospiraceae bacterium]
MQEESYILLPVTIPQDDLEAFINQSLPLDLYTGSEEELGFDVEGTRKGKIEVRMEGHEIFYKLNLAVTVSKSTFLSDIEGKGSLELELKTSFTITENWELDSQTVLEFYEWIEAPKVKIGIATIPVKNITDNFIKRNRERITAAIDKAIKEKVKLQELLLPAWQKLNEPIDIKEPFELHFLMQADSIKLSPPLGKTANIWSHIFLPVDPVLKVGKGVHIHENKLPPFHYHYKREDEFSLRIPAELPYEIATRLATENVRGKELEVQGQTIYIETIHVEQFEGKVSVDVSFSGSLKGVANATFLPAFSSEDNDLVLNEMTFKVKSKNVLAKGAIWLFKERIIHTIRENATYFLNSLKKDIQNIIQRELDALALPDIADLDINLDLFDITQIDVLEDKLIIQTHLTGNGLLKLKLMGEVGEV